MHNKTIINLVCYTLNIIASLPLAIFIIDFFAMITILIIQTPLEGFFVGLLGISLGGSGQFNTQDILKVVSAWIFIIGIILMIIKYLFKLDFSKYFGFKPLIIVLLALHILVYLKLGEGFLAFLIMSYIFGVMGLFVYKLINSLVSLLQSHRIDDNN